MNYENLKPDSVKPIYPLLVTIGLILLPLHYMTKDAEATGYLSGGDYKIVSPSGKTLEKCKMSNSGYVCRDISGKMLYKIIFE